MSRSGPDFRSRRAPGRNVFRDIGRALQAVTVLLLTLLVGIALAFQLAGTAQAAALGGLALLAALFAVFWARRQSAALWVGTALLLAAAAIWWSTIRPSNTRDWAEDVAYGVTAEIGVDDATLMHVRDFEWTSPTQFVPQWRTETYRLSDLTSMDLVTSVWASPSIAHTLVSFGFADGRHVVFSAEIRREQNEAFSSLGGFFRQFELVLIAAEESDIIRMRTDIRREWVSVFPLSVSPEVRQDLFLSFLTLGNDLAAHPRFYNSLTTNCTTVVWRLARALGPGLPLDWRIILSGHLPAYLQDRGVAGQGMTRDAMMAGARRGPIGPAGADGAAYSRLLRTGPGGFHDN